MKKKITVALLLLGMIFSKITSFAAVQEGRLIQEYEVQDHNLEILCAGSETEETCVLKIDGNVVKTDEKSIEEAKLPVTVFCLVDVSGSMSPNKLNLMKETLTCISNHMRPGDHMVLATVGDELQFGEKLSTPEERETAIGTIAAQNKDTNLYAGIIESLQELGSNPEYDRAKSLLILSDGVDEQDNGMTEQEVLKVIDQSRIPIYTVALSEEKNSAEGAKILGSFSRNSCGGIHQSTFAEGSSQTIRTDVSGTEFGNAIWNSVIRGVFLQADISELSFERTRSKIPVKVELETNGHNYTDTIELEISLFPVLEKTDEPKENVLWIAGISAVILLLLLIIILIVVLKKRKKSSGESQTEERKDEENKEEENSSFPMNMETAPEKEKVEKSDFVQKEKPVKYLISMVDIPYGEKEMNFSIRDEKQVTFGRNKKASYVLDPRDDQLSAVHFSLLLNGTEYRIRDEESTNGTRINGIRIPALKWTPIESNDKIRAGKKEYRMIIVKIR